MTRLKLAGRITALGLFLGVSGPAMAQGTLRIGMTASDIPLTTGQTDNGGEGQRFLGFTAYDALVNWDLAARPSRPTSCPGWRPPGRSMRPTRPSGCSSCATA